MFDIPANYKVGLVTDKTKIPLSQLKPTDRKRFRRALKNLTLESVVNDDLIPPFTSDTHSIGAVQFFSADIDSIRSAPFVCGVLQRITKTLCAIKIRDERQEMYSFALKRLNLQDKNSIVVVDEFLTGPLQCSVKGEENRLIYEFARWDSVVNKTNLYSWYLEMMVKCYIIAHREVWSEMNNLLSSNIWYNTEDVIMMYDEVKKLVKLMEQRNKSVTIGNSAQLNGEIKREYEKLRDYF